MNALDAAIGNEADPTRELWAAAAVRERFRAGNLLAQWYAKHEHADAETREAALLTSIAIQDLATPAQGSDGGDAFRLPTELRKRALEGFGAGLMRNAIDAVPEEDRTPVEQMLCTMLHGRRVAVDRRDRQQLTALRVATGCAVAAGVDPGITEAELDSEVQRLDLMLALGGPDLHRFVGRERDLQALCKLWREHAEGVAIEGPGGMGKSLLVSRFVSDLLEGDPLERPMAVFHLDFDRRDLQGGGSSSSLDALTSELIRQAGRWLPREEAEALADLGPSSAAFELESFSFSRSSRNFAGRGGLVTGLADCFHRLSDRHGPDPRILLIFDSMEQILGFDDEAEHAIAHIARMFGRGRVEAFVVCVSRSFSRARESLRWIGRKPISLTQFSSDEARSYLVGEAGRAGIELDDRIIDRVIATVGRSPLALRLAVSLMEKEGDAFDPKLWVKALRDDPERIQASLYDRILKRIRDKDLVKVARPGLLVRRLTPDVIEQVLAEPCDLRRSPNLASDLMHKAQLEGQLFTVNPDDRDPDALWHRSDVRALMLPDLDSTIEEGVANDINRRAVAYYAVSDDLTSRTEELYHRLRLGQSADELDPRWTEAAGLRLRAVLEELPPQSRAYVRRRLGSASLTGVRDAGAGMGANRELREVVRRELQALADRADPMATLARFGADRMRGELADLYAEALLSSGKLDQLLEGAAQLSASGDAPQSVLAAVSNIAGSVLEGLGRLGEAFDCWQSAVDLAKTDDEESLHIAVAARVGALRTARKQDEIRHFANFRTNRSKQIDKTLGLALPILFSLSRRAVEARELVAELGDPKGEPAVPEPLFRIFEDLIGSGEAFPSLTERPQRMADLARELQLQATSPRQLWSLLSKMAYGSETGRLVELMREEVDWTLARAVRAIP